MVVFVVVVSAAVFASMPAVLGAVSASVPAVLGAVSAFVPAVSASMPGAVLTSVQAAVGVVFPVPAVGAVAAVSAVCRRSTKSSSSGCFSLASRSLKWSFVVCLASPHRVQYV